MCTSEYLTELQRTLHSQSPHKICFRILMDEDAYGPVLSLSLLRPIFLH